MYVAPRPRIADDPHFAARLALGVTLLFVIAVLSGSPLPMAYPALGLGVLAGNIKGFDPGRMIAAPIIVVVMLWLNSIVISALLPFPLVLIGLLLAVNVLAFYIIQSTGNSVGLLLLIFPALMSMMAFDSLIMMEVMRNEMSKAAIFTGLMAPFLFALLPPRATAPHKPVYERGHDDGQYLLRAVIRAGVLLAFTFCVYTLLGSANLMIVVAGIFVLCFPTKQTLWAEARERTLSTGLGALAAAPALIAASFVGHPAIVLTVIYLTALWTASHMFAGRHAPMVYQFTLSVAVSIIGGGLSTQEPLYASATRIVLTLGGAVLAAFLTALLEDLLTRPQSGEKALAAHGAAAQE